MAGEQTAYLDSGATGTDVVVAINCIDSTGSHTTLTIDTTTTRLHGYSVVPTADLSVGTGIATITFANVQSLTEGQRLVCKINGTANGTAFSEYAIPVIVRADERGTDSVTSLDAAGVRTAVGLASANLDTQLGDIPTVSEFNARTKPTADYFDHTSDQVAVSAVNDKTGYSLATAPPTAAEVYAEFTSGSNEDAFKADVSGLSTFDPSTDQVVASNMRGTDNALLAASAPSNFGSLGINSSGHILRTVLNDTTTTNTDMVSVSGLAQSSEIAALNDISAADVWSYATRTITSGGITAGEVSDAVWDVSLSGYNSAGSTGKALKQVKEGIVSQDGSVNDTSATTTSFVTNLASAVDGFYHDKVLVFVSGSLLGQARHIEDYNGTTKAITLSVPLTSAPSNGSEFLILSGQSFSLNEHADAVWDEQRGSSRASGSFGYYVDAAISGISSGGGDATASNQTTIIDHLTDIKGATFSESTDSLEAIRDRGDAAWLTSSAAGTGLYEVTVTVEDSSNNALQGARIAVEGTTLFLTTDSSGTVTFNLDSGVYLLACSPPAGYQTPTDLVASVSTSNVSVEFTLTANPSSSCDQPWIG